MANALSPRLSLGACLLLIGACGPKPTTDPADASATDAVEDTAAPAAAFSVQSGAYADGEAIPADYAFCVPAEENHVTMGTNKNPEITWANAPEGTKSFAIVMHDPDVPSVMDNVNQEGKTIAKDLPRITFVHWVLTDIPASASSLAEGADSAAITPRGKPPGPSDIGNRGVNDYTMWFASDENMAGNYGGYDGPCPPWNDERVHHYITTVYALDVERLEVGENFNLEAATAAMEGHVLAEASVTGVYSLNPSVDVLAGE